MVVRLRLEQKYRRNYCSQCMTGCLGCRWHRYKQSTANTSAFDLVWLAFLFGCSICSVFSFYALVLGENDMVEIDRLLFEKTGTWFHWYILLFALGCLALIYSTLVLLFAIYHASAGKEIYIHWVHKSLLLVLCASVLAFIISASQIYPRFDDLMRISLQATGPWLYLAAVVVLTLMSWVVARKIFHLNSKGLQALWTVLYLLLLSLLFVVPYFVKESSPLVGVPDLSWDRPRLVARGGCSRTAPDSTVMAVRKAVDAGVFGVIAEIHTTADGVPVLLTRQAFDVLLPRLQSDWGAPNVSRVNYTQLASLDYGELYYSRDPFYALHVASDEDKKLARGQRLANLTTTVGALVNTSVKLILENEIPFNETKVVRLLVQETGLKQSQIILMRNGCVGDVTVGGYDVGCVSLSREKERRANGKSLVYTHYGDFRSFAHVQNMSVGREKEIVYHVEEAWLYSLLWGHAVWAVSTKSCTTLAGLARPSYSLTETEHLVMWSLTAVLSLLFVALAFTLQRYRQCPQHKYRMDSVTSATNMAGPSSITVIRERVGMGKRDMKEKLIEENYRIDSLVVDNDALDIAVVATDAV